MIDLHTHSTASDGTDSPGQLLRAAAAAGVTVLGLTDHDTLAGWAPAAAAVRETGVALVRGVEISTTDGSVPVHLLGYLFDPTSGALAAEMARTRDSRATRLRRMTENVSIDYPITWDDVLDQRTDHATLGRPHLADALVAAGAVPNREAAFATLLHPRGPYYVPYYAPTTAAMVRAVAEAGGVSVAAHPAGRRPVPDAQLAALAEIGLFGLEVDHREHSPAAREHLSALAVDLGLVVTGASDFHGSGKPNRLGEHTTSPEVLERIVAASRLPVIWP